MRSLIPLLTVLVPALAAPAAAQGSASLTERRSPLQVLEPDDDRA